MQWSLKLSINYKVLLLTIYFLNLVIAFDCIDIGNTFTIHLQSVVFKLKFVLPLFYKIVVPNDCMFVEMLYGDCVLVESVTHQFNMTVWLKNIVLIKCILKCVVHLTVFVEMLCRLWAPGRCWHRHQQQNLPDDCQSPSGL